MKKYILFTVLLIFINVFCLKADLFGDQDKISKEEIAEIVNMLRGDDWGGRVSAFYRVTGPISIDGSQMLEKKYGTPKVREALFFMLKDSWDSKRGYEPSEGTTDNELIEVMGNMGETRAIPYLLAQVSGGGAAIYALAKIGEPAVEHVIEKLKSGSNETKTSCVYVLGEMVKEKKAGYVAKGATREKIKQALIKSSNSAKHPIPHKSPSNKHEAEKFKYNERMAANLRIALVRAYGNLGDKDIIPLIERLAKEDPYFEDFSKDPHSKVSKRYKVREEAQKVLEKLKKEGKIKE